MRSRSRQDVLDASFHQLFHNGQNGVPCYEAKIGAFKKISVEKLFKSIKLSSSFAHEACVWLCRTPSYSPPTIL